MSFESHVLSYFQELEALKNLSERANKALLDLLVLAVLTDSEVSEGELKQLDEELLRLPFLWDTETRERVVEHSSRTRDYVESILGDEGKLQIFIKGVADEIEGDEHRVVAMRMFIAVVVADGINDLERERIFDVGSAFGFESDVIAEIIDDVRNSLS